MIGTEARRRLALEPHEHRPGSKCERYERAQISPAHRWDPQTGRCRDCGISGDEFHEATRCRAADNHFID